MGFLDKLFGKKKREQDARPAEGLTHSAEMPCSGEDAAEKDRRPYHAVRHDGYGIHSGEQGPEQDGEAP